MKNIIQNLNIEQVIQILIAIGVVIGFRICSSFISGLIIKLLRPKTKEKKNVKKNPFYLPLKTIFTFIGVYIALNMLKGVFVVSLEITEVINKILKIAMIIFVAKAFGQGLDDENGVFTKIKMKSGKEFDQPTMSVMLRTIKIVIYIISAFMVISELGYNISGFITGLGLGGVVITLAAQDTAKSLIGGAAIFIDKPFKVGDFITIGTYQGTVEEIKLRSTSIRTLENSVLHIPNSEVSISAVINYSEMEKRRYYSILAVTLDTKLEKLEIVRQQIEKMLLEMDVVEKESVIVKFQDISARGMEIVIIAYVNETNYNEYLKIKEQINYQIMTILQNQNVEIAYNTHNIYMKNK